MRKERDMPYRGTIRRTDTFDNRGYHQIFVKNLRKVCVIDVQIIHIIMQSIFLRMEK